MSKWDDYYKKFKKEKEEEEKKQADREKSLSAMSDSDYYWDGYQNWKQTGKLPESRKAEKEPEPEEEEPKRLTDRLAARGIQVEMPEPKKTAKAEDTRPTLAEAAAQGNTGSSLFTDRLRNTATARAEEENARAKLLEEERKNQTVRNDEWLSSLRTPEEIRAELDEARADLEEEQKRRELVSSALSTSGWGTDAEAEENREFLEGLTGGKDSSERVKALEDELAERTWADYERLRNNPDFAEKSQYDEKGNATGEKTKLNPAGGYDSLAFKDPEYAYVNGNEEAGTILSNESREAGEANGLLGLLVKPKEYEFTQLSEMSDEEKALYNYIHATQGQQAAHGYLEYLRSDLYARQAEREKAEAAAYAEEHPVLSTVRTIGISPLRGAGYLGQTAQYLTEGTVDANAPYNRLSYLTSAERNVVNNTVERSWGKVGTFAYGVGVSMAEFLLNSALAGGGASGLSEALSLTLMGSGAAADATIEAKERGLSDEQSYALGTIAGLAEILTEKVSVENLFNGKWETEPLRYLFKNTIAEGSEEAGSDLINWFADVMIARDKSEWQQAINKYMTVEHMNEHDAFIAALKDKGLEILLDAASGALSGFLMAVGPSAKGLAQRSADRSADIEAARAATQAVKRLGQKNPNVTGGIEQAQQNAPQAAQSTGTPTEGIMLPTAEEAETAERASAEKAKKTPAGTEEAAELRFGTEPEVRTLTPTVEEAETNDAVRKAEAEGNITRATGLRYGIDEKTIRKAERLSETTGMTAQWYEGQPRKGAVENGYTNKRTGDVFINKNAKKVFEFIFGHEFTHNLEGTEEYDALLDHIKERAMEEGTDWLQRRADMRDLYERGTGETLSDEEIDQEIAADWIGEHLSGERTIREICRETPSAAKKIRDALDSLVIRAANAGGIMTPYEERKYRNMIGLIDRYIGEANRNLERNAQEAAQTNETAQAAVYPAGAETMQMSGAAEGTEGGESPAEYLARMTDLYEAGEISEEDYEAAEDLAAEMESTGRGIESSTVAREEGPKGKIAEAVDRLRGRYSLSPAERAERQYDIIQNANPAEDDQHTWIRSADEIMDYRSAVEDFGALDGGVSPDFTAEDVRAALDSGRMTVYSSKPIEAGGFVTPSRMEARDYAGGGRVYSKVVALDDVAWIDASEGQYAPVTEEVGSGEGIPAAVSNSGETLTEELRGGTMVRYSLTSWSNTDKDAVMKNLVDAGYSWDDAQAYIDNVNSIAAIIAGDRGRLDYDAADNQVFMKPNAEYVITLDASTLCAKRLVYQGTFDKIQHALGNRVLMPEDLIDLANMMGEDGYQTPCGICYVESRRRHLGKFASQWLESYRGDYIPSLDEVTTTDGLENLRKTHPQAYEDFIKAMNKKGTMNPKVVQLRTDYRGDINKLTKGKIEKIKRIGGVRVQSFSDFETPHLIDMMQAILDMSAKKLPAQAYTKVPNFAWAFGDTGIKINLSLIGGIDADGNLTFSSVEGMDFDEAMRLRDRYSENVGTILVGMNDAHILAAMADPRIDYIIPFHKSGWSAEELAKMKSLRGFEDYTDQQNEKRIVGKKQNGGYETESLLEDEGNLYPKDYWDYNVSGKENAERYLALCAEQNRLPKFSKFLVDNGDGSFSLQPDGSTDGYWKTLIDYKMYDNAGKGAPQRAVTPDFNMEECRRILSEYEGGANELPSASDEFIRKYVDHYEDVHGNEDVRYSLTNTAQGPVVVLDEDITENKPEDQKYTEYIESYLADLFSDESYLGTLPESGMKVYASEELPNEYSGSTYTKYLRNRKQERFYAKMKAASSLDELVEIATGRKWEKAKHEHNKDAKYGVYKYNARFAFPVKDSAGKTDSYRAYTCDLVIINASDGKKYLYDIINIKEDTATAGELSQRDTRKGLHQPQPRSAFRSIVSQPGADVNGEGENSVRMSLSPEETEQRDEDYRAAVEAGDMETAQRMVDEAAKAAGAMTLPNGKRKPYYHGTAEKFTVFDINKSRDGMQGYGFYFTPMKHFAEGYGEAGAYYLMTDRIATRDDHSITPEQVVEIREAYGLPVGEDGLEKARDWVANSNDMDIIKRLESAITRNTDAKPEEFLRRFREVFGYDGLRHAYETVLWDNKLMKSADPVTYDDEGNVIPLSERFNPENPDIRYSLAEDADYMAAVEAGDEETQSEMVRDAAERAGYKKALFHGTGEYFNLFRRGAEGIHLGNREQAEQVARTRFNDRSRRTNYEWNRIRQDIGSMDEEARQDLVSQVYNLQDYLDWRDDYEYFPPYEGDLMDDERLLAYLDSVMNKVTDLTGEVNPKLWTRTYDRQTGERVMELYAKINNPLNFNHDMMYWSPQNIANALLAHQGGETAYLGRYMDDAIDLTAWDIDLSEEEIEALSEIANSFKYNEDSYWDVIADVLEAHGFDGIEYLNEAEGDQNSYSYIALRPSDVKSADPVTYDNEGNVIPLSERFNPENPDIRYSLDEDYVPFNSRAVISEETVDRYLRDYAAQSSPNYAQAYITRMRPNEFLDLTTSRTGRILINAETEPLNLENLTEASRHQPIQIRIEDGEVVGHEGRHRANALAREGVRSIPVLVFDSSNKYDKTDVPEMTLRGQDFGNGRSSDARVTIRDLIPLNYANRDRIVEAFSKQDALERINEKYGIRQTVRFSLGDGQEGQGAQNELAGMSQKAKAAALRIERQFTSDVLQGIERNLNPNSAEFRQFRADVARPVIEAMLRGEEADVDAVLESTGIDIVGQAAARGAVKDAIRRASGEIGRIRTAVQQTNARQQAREARNAELDARIPDTSAGLIDLANTVKDARKRWNTAKARTIMTEEDLELAHRIATGQITPEEAFAQNALGMDDIINMAEAEKAFLEANAPWERYVKRLARRRYDTADARIANADRAKDKGNGFAYARETPERNFRDVFGSDAAALIDDYIRPVHTAEAESTRFKNEFNKRVRDLKLDQKVRRGNENSEAAAVQFIGEAEDNIRVLELARSQNAVRDGKTLEEWRAEIEAFRNANPNMDYEKVNRGIEEFRSIYNELITRMNEVLVENGYMPVNVRRGYFPHFNGGSDGVLATFAHLLGINIDTNALPTAINGLTSMFKPGKPWFSHAMERTGFATDYDAIEGFDGYLGGVSDVIHQTGNIRNLRALGTRIRYMMGDEQIKRRIDEIEADETRTEQEKLAAIQDLTDNGRYKLSRFVSWLDEYTNLLANKKSKFDRGVEDLMGRRVYTWMKNIEGRVAANMIAGNLGSAFTNFIPLNQAGAVLGDFSMLRGAWDTLVHMGRGDNFVRWSDFLTNRRGADPLIQNRVDKISKVLSSPMEIIDNFASETIVRAAYGKYRRSGMDAESAMQAADELAAGLMADRSKGAQPTIFGSHNPLMKLFTQFQVEVNNEFSTIFKDIPKGVYRRDEDRKKLAAVAAWTLLRYFIGAYLFNDLYEKVVGRRAALDPIDILNDAVGDLTGKKLNNTWDALVGGEGFIEVQDRKNRSDALINFGQNLGEELPFVGGALFGGGRIPIKSALPSPTTIIKGLTNENWEGDKKLEALGRELGNTVGTYWIPPFAGGAIKKGVQTAETALAGGRYVKDAEGNDQLQYPFFTDTPLETAGTLLTSAAFGPTATKGGRDWVEGGFGNQSAKNTALYRELTGDLGESQRESWDFLQSLRQQDTQGKRMAIAESGLTDEGKALAMERIMNSGQSTEGTKFRAAYDSGVSADVWAEFYRFLPDYDKDGNKSYTQAEIAEALDDVQIPLSSGEGAAQGLFGGSTETRHLTNSEKAALWSACNPTWATKNNPYDPKIGERVVSRYNALKGGES